MSPGFNRSSASPGSSSSTATVTPVNRAISRVALQPSTPIVVPPTPSPNSGPSKATATSSLSASSANGGLGSNSNSASVGPSPSPSSHDLVMDVEEVERQTNRRSMYRSPGTSSSPDLATLLRKAKERGGAMVGGAAASAAAQTRAKRRDEPTPPLPDQASRQPTSSQSCSSATLVALPSSGEGIDSPQWVLASPNRVTVKAPKRSVRAKTSAFWGKVMGQTTVRERSKTDASLHPPSHSTTPPLMNAFIPPVPALPSEHRSPVTSPIADVFSTSPRVGDGKKGLPSRKPLPPIIAHSPSNYREGEDIDRSMVFVEKQSALPPLPPPSPGPSTPTALKRRSASVSNADMKFAISQTPANSPTLSKTPDNIQMSNGRHSKDNTLHCLLDVFKGELSTLDPFSGASLELRDPATPDRLESNEVALPSSLSLDPFITIGNRAERDVEAPATAPSAIIPPRSASLNIPTRYSIGSAVHASSSRQLNSTPLRSRSGPPATLTVQSQNNAGNRLRVLHHSTASNSEPSLIPLPDHASNRPSSSPLTTSQQDLASPEYTHFRKSPTPIITGDDSEDMETRGKELANRCWNENDDFLAKEKIAEWLGGLGQINKAALRHYINFFDFTGLRLDLAFRRLCGKLYLKGETQQVDRILEQFSRRYWDCNPGGLYGSANIVHAVAYSLLLLNTDLHVAELQTRMSRTQFVRNTITAIQTQLQPTFSAQLSTSDLTYDDCSSSVRGAASDETEIVTRLKRSNSVTSWNSQSREAILSVPVSPAPTRSGQLEIHLANSSTPSVRISNGYDQTVPNRQSQAHGRAWESDMETLLKEMYNAIKHQQILQPINSSVTRISVSSLSPGGGGMTRNRSLRGQPDRLTTLKRGSIHKLQSILSVQSGASPYSSNSSIDGRVSPSPSFATSTHDGMYGSSSSFLNPTLGFASNLSHTIIREAQEDDDRSIRSEGSTSTTISISDEELALLGAPWAKEGMLCRKQYWESAGKRAKDKAWMDVFVVIQKGELNMFIFGDHTSGGSGTFGGGNWLANAQPVGTIHLAHSLAHSLPPPGYNKRAHCMVLTMANRGVYFFQAGTEELVNEWVSTCNYWAARTSKEPLSGGVSNMEYGWNRVADVYGNGRSLSQTDIQRESELPDTVSVRSGKSSRSRYGWKDGSATIRGPYSPRADKTFINEWKAPLPPTVSSVHDEESQLDALKKHVVSLKKELEVHNELREPMTALYLSRSSSAMKAQSNWEEKSQYLLRESVKYELYIDSLQAAMSLRLKKRGEKALERALSHPVDEPLTGSSKWKGPEGLPIAEEVEPTTPDAKQQFLLTAHKREVAEIDDDTDG